MEAICIIPARSGSKRIPGKNIKGIQGKSLISYTIENAIKSNVFQKIVVSTDSEEIAQISRNSGAEVPFIRDAILSDDSTPTKPVIGDAIRRLGVQKKNFLLVACIYPFAVQLSPKRIRESISRYLEINQPQKFLASVKPYTHPIERSFKIEKSGFLKANMPKQLQVRTQDLKQSYFDAGQIYVGTVSAWLSNLEILESAVPLILGKYETIDVDDVEDFSELETRLRSGVTAKEWKP